jgi:ornithine cyclodeaminase/alanine dehydrogenase-like protein (mu-crystallin family)
MLLLTNEDVQQVLSMSTCIAILRRFFEAASAGRVLSRPRTECWLPRDEGSGFYECKTMEGGVPYLGRHVLRIDSNVSEEKARGPGTRVEHRPLMQGGWMGSLLVFDTATGALLGIMPDGYLQRTRVGALYALAADYLARRDATRVGLIGSGWQAGGQLLGLCGVRSIAHIRVYSPNPEHREAFAHEMTPALGVPVEAVDTARRAVQDTDIVALATNAGQKVAEAEWAEPGQHVNSVRYRELDPLLYDRAEVVVVNREEPWIQHHYLEAQRPRDVILDPLPIVPPDRAIEARTFFAKRAGRPRGDAVTLFPNEASNYQIGGQFAAVGSVVLDACREQGLGRDLPLEWFAQALHP